jgi:hypothetical protein
MIIPFHVYTARDGYAWLGVEPSQRPLLDTFRKAIGRMPDFDIGETERHGVLNIKELLQTSPFTTPQQNPPINISYQGTPSAPGEFTLPEKADTGTFHPAGSLASCGAVFSQVSSGSLHIFVDETTPPQPAQFRYTPAPVKASPKQAPEEDPIQPISIPAPAPSTQHHNKRQTLLLAILLSLIAIFISQQFKIFWNKRASKPPREIIQLDNPPESSLDNTEQNREENEHE